jgi:hypothetical protein
MSRVISNEKDYDNNERCVRFIHELQEFYGKQVVFSNKFDNEKI